MINLKSRTVRSMNNLVNLSFFTVNILFSYLFIFMTKYKGVYEEILFISGIAFGSLPIYYFYKQFSSKGRYINILPVSMKKMYLITFMDWFIIYIMSNFITALMLNKVNLGYEIYLYSPSIIIPFGDILNFLKINFLIILGVIIVKFYKVNEILALGVFLGIGKIVDVLGSSYLGKQDLNLGFFSMLLGRDYSIMNVLIFILAGVLFLFTSSKLDKLSIE